MGGKSQFSSDDANRQRPNHPDFWKMSEVVVALDAEAELQGFEAVIRPIIDVEVLFYMARQRVMRCTQIAMAAGNPFAAPDVTWVDAFVAGVRWAEKRKAED